MLQKLEIGDILRETQACLTCLIKLFGTNKFSVYKAKRLNIFLGVKHLRIGITVLGYESNTFFLSTFYKLSKNLCMKDNWYIKKGKAKKDQFIGRKFFFSIKTNKNKDCHREAEEINNFFNASPKTYQIHYPATCLK